MVAHALSIARWRERQSDLCEIEASLVYKANSRTGSQRNKETLS